MSTVLPVAAEVLRVSLEERSEAMSSAAQMCLEEMERHGASHEVRQDMKRVLETARAIYRLVHKQLSSAHFADLKKSAEEEIQRIRHDLRGLLQNILMRGELLLEEVGLAEGMKEEIAAIRTLARECVASVNANRDGIVTEDVTLHLLPASVGGGSDTNRSALPARVLIADDNAQSRELLTRFLQKLGHQVVEARTGNEALHKIAQEDFDLVLLDIVMPELNGFEVLERLRVLGKLQHTPVILISGMDTEASAIRGIELGAEDFLPRPVDLSLLRARVNASLERQRLRERELARFFTPQLARHLHRHPELLATGRSTEVTVLFCDIVGFSRVSEKLGPGETIGWVSAVLGAMSECVMNEDGVLVDFSGDQIMALWGAPQEQADHAARACRCAAAMRDRLPALDEAWKAVIGGKTEVTVGINTGSAFVGNVGTPQKFKFGALGHCVNVASRVQSAAKFVGAPLLLTKATQTHLPSKMVCRRLGRVQVNNITEPVQLYELCAPDMDPSIVRAYEQVLSSYEAQDLATAAGLIHQMLEKYPYDGPARELSRLIHSRPSEPVWILPGK
jgi:adenylate cyclase